MTSDEDWMVAELSRRVARKIARSLGAAPAVAPPFPVSAQAQALVEQANGARDHGRFAVAAVHYAQALQLQPDLGPIHVQAGHMFKESGDLDAAERHYGEARRLMPDDADLALQLGHFYKISGRLPEAHEAYVRAVQLAPGSQDAEEALEHLSASGWRSRAERWEVERAQPTIRPEDLDPEGRPEDLKLAALYGHLAPEMIQPPLRELLRYSDESISVRQFGIEQRTFWGHKAVVRGVEAIRGVVISKTQPDELQARVNGLLIHRGAPKGPYELEYEPDKNRIHKYVFNIWHDFSAFAFGHYELELIVKTAGEPDRSFNTWFVVEAPLSEEVHPESDGILNLPADVASIEAAVDARPSVVREAWRPNQLGEIKTILVCRSDQLGDFVASIPGILRLREIFPQARLVGLFSPSNIGLARSLGVFEDIILVNHVESWHARIRTLTLAEQQDIRDRCEPYRFDLAIDLAQSLMGRAILALSGARLTYGFRDPQWSRTSMSYDDALFDPKNRREIATHSKRIVNMIDRLHTLTHPAGKVIRREDLSRERLYVYGLEKDDRYAVLHTGARIVWSRWAHYLQLAAQLIRDTDLKVVLFTDDRELKTRLPDELQGEKRLIILDGHLPFDDFDAVLSYCQVYVGNDSGPKHLASLRGVPVVSIHSSRINWSEWGQEMTGVVISRKVPCAACHIYHDPDECGKDFACMKIGFQEVYDAVRRYV